METPQFWEQLTALLKATLGAQVALTDYTIHKREQDYLVLTARLQQPALAVMLKLAGPRAPLDCAFERTAALLRLVASATSVPVNCIIAADVSYQTWPWRYCLYRQLPGQPWGEIRERLSPAQYVSAQR